ncbi:MAG: hypothetical protein Kow001_11010 [Acidobacteriota bacterium]
MAFLLTPLVLIGLVLYVAWPLLRDQPESAPSEESELEKALDQKEQALSDLKDIEMDFRMGKLSAEDYQRLRQEFEARAIQALERVDSLEKRAKPARRRS